MKNTWYKIQTGRTEYRTYYVWAESPRAASKDLQENWNDYFHAEEELGDEIITQTETVVENSVPDWEIWQKQKSI